MKRPIRTLRLSREAGVALLLLGLAVAAALASPTFLSVANLRDMAAKIAPAVIVACGMTFLIVVREIDVSVGATMGLCAAAMGVVASPERMGLGTAWGAGACLGVGLIVGLANGMLVTLGRAPSILATLGTMMLAQGLTERLMAGKWIQGLPDGLRWFGIGSWLGMPVGGWIALAVVAGAAVWAVRTPSGRHAYALGGNPNAAHLAGIAARPIRLLAFACTGLLAGVAALVGATQLEVIESGFGRGFELTVIAAVVVGGTSIRGGRGTVGGSAVGAALLGLIGTILIFLKLGDASIYWERAIQGVVILAAVMLERRKPWEATA